MYRIDDQMDWCDLEQLAEDIGAKLVYRKARCQHGRTRQESCRSCEAGYVDDMHTFAAGIGRFADWQGLPCISVSDDGEDVAYLPLKYQARIYQREPIEQLRKLARGHKTRDGLEILIQRILSRLYHYKHIEMQSSIVHIGVSGNVDSAAWSDIKGLSPAEAKPSVRFLGDGSAVTCHYSPEGLPQYRRFTRTLDDGERYCPNCHDSYNVAAGCVCGRR